MNQALLISRKPIDEIGKTIAELLVGTKYKNGTIYHDRKIPINFKIWFYLSFLLTLTIAILRVSTAFYLHIVFIFIISISLGLLFSFLITIIQKDKLSGINLSVGRDDETVILIKRWNDRNERIFDDDVVYHIIEAIREVDFLVKVVE